MKLLVVKLVICGLVCVLFVYIIHGCAVDCLIERSTASLIIVLFLAVMALGYSMPIFKLSKKVERLEYNYEKLSERYDEAKNSEYLSGISLISTLNHKGDFDYQIRNGSLIEKNDGCYFVFSISNIDDSTRKYKIQVTRNDGERLSRESNENNLIMRNNRFIIKL